MAQFWLQRRFLLLMAMVVVVLSLTAAVCGGGDGIGPSPTATHHPSPTATHHPSPTPNPASLFTFNNSAPSANIGDLYVNTYSLLDCGMTPVLPGNPTEYDAGTIQTLQTELNSGKPSSNFLRTVPGDFGAADQGQPNDCDGAQILVTNFSNSTFTLKGVAITTVVSSVTNPYHYNLYDCAPYKPNCPFTTTTFVGIVSHGGFGPECVTQPFSLAPSKAGFSRVEDCEQSQQTPVITPIGIPAGQVGEIDLGFTSTTPNQLYKVSISLIWSDGTRLMLPEIFDYDVVFSSPSQFSCYSLAGTSVVEVSVLHSDCA